MRRGKNRAARLLIEVFLCFDSQALCAAAIRLQRGAPASAALLQFGAADILEPVGQQNGESTEMHQAQKTPGGVSVVPLREARFQQRTRA